MAHTHTHLHIHKKKATEVASMFNEIACFHGPPVHRVPVKQVKGRRQHDNCHGVILTVISWTVSYSVYRSSDLLHPNTEEGPSFYSSNKKRNKH